jgi:putative SOS response-associated peptidase YedK
MCGRFTVKMTWSEIVALYKLTLDRTPHNLPPRYNVCPTDPIDVITEQDGKTSRSESSSCKPPPHPESKCCWSNEARSSLSARLIAGFGRSAFDGSYSAWRERSQTLSPENRRGPKVRTKRQNRPLFLSESPGLLDGINAMRNQSDSQYRQGWCGREDSNLHGLPR